MTILIIVLVIGLIWFIMKIGFNIGALIGVALGAIIGSNIGIAGGGNAVSGTIIFGLVGFILGGLIHKNWRNSIK